MPETGLEPARAWLAHQPLKLARLPIPPLRRRFLINNQVQYHDGLKVVLSRDYLKTNREGNLRVVVSMMKRVVNDVSP